MCVKRGTFMAGCSGPHFYVYKTIPHQHVPLTMDPTSRLPSGLETKRLVSSIILKDQDNVELPETSYRVRKSQVSLSRFSGPLKRSQYVTGTILTRPLGPWIVGLPAVETRNAVLESDRLTLCPVVCPDHLVSETEFVSLEVCSSLIT